MRVHSAMAVGELSRRRGEIDRQGGLVRTVQHLHACQDPYHVAGAQRSARTQLDVRRTDQENCESRLHRRYAARITVALWKACSASGTRGVAWTREPGECPFKSRALTAPVVGPPSSVALHFWRNEALAQPVFHMLKY